MESGPLKNGGVGGGVYILCKIMGEGHVNERKEGNVLF